MKRFGQIIKLRPGRLDIYREYHAEVWPDVLKRLEKSNIRNYSIFHKDGYLFGYYEYIGSDYEKDMADLAADAVTKDWWKIMKPMQQPFKSRNKGEWWADMEEVFHTD